MHFYSSSSFDEKYTLWQSLQLCTLIYFSKKKPFFFAVSFHISPKVLIFSILQEGKKIDYR